MEWTVRRLVDSDVEAYRELRLAGLASDPEAFGSTLEAEAEQPLEQFAGSLQRSFVVGAFAADEPSGVAALLALQGPKMRHRANMWGVYVRPADRGRGAAGAMIAALLAHAARIVKQVHLSVVVDNAPAMRLYQRAGFHIYGTEPRSLYVNGRYYDEHLMVRLLDEAPGKQSEK